MFISSSVGDSFLFMNSSLYYENSVNSSTKSKYYKGKDVERFHFYFLKIIENLNYNKWLGESKIVNLCRAT